MTHFFDAKMTSLTWYVLFNLNLVQPPLNFWFFILIASLSSLLLTVSLLTLSFLSEFSSFLPTSSPLLPFSLASLSSQNYHRSHYFNCDHRNQRYNHHQLSPNQHYTIITTTNAITINTTSPH